ncbi:MAG: prepilin-type N-terminal cleavage/methylation domain-containing protein [Planctomycetes bacterium]|nr:prepilin-type N-terminal cleavage/methylation domain-containing protein [Planctomycetota bacterium]
MKYRLQSTRYSGFTLIEVLAVIVILGILMIILLPRLAKMSDKAKEKATGAWLLQIETAIGEYERHFGDYPPSQFQEKWGAAPNLTNLGAETLVISLWSTDWGGTSLQEDKFSNTDNDEAKKNLTRFPANTLFELKDEWGNPIAYFHRRDFGRVDTYAVVNPETGEAEESRVKAYMSPTTKTYFNSNKFQLISSGLDGMFNTDDDITTFKRD